MVNDRKKCFQKISFLLFCSIVLLQRKSPPSLSCHFLSLHICSLSSLPVSHAHTHIHMHIPIIFVPFNRRIFSACDVCIFLRSVWHQKQNKRRNSCTAEQYAHSVDIRWGFSTLSRRPLLPAPNNNNSKNKLMCVSCTSGRYSCCCLSLLSFNNNSISRFFQLVMTKQHPANERH